MNYLLDTNTCIYIINKKPSSVVERIQTKRPEQIAISTITQAELEYGIARSKNPEQNRVALLEFLFPFLLLDFDQMAAVQYGSDSFVSGIQRETDRAHGLTACCSSTVQRSGSGHEQ